MGNDLFDDDQVGQRAMVSATTLERLHWFSALLFVIILLPLAAVMGHYHDLVGFLFFSFFFWC